MSLLFIVLMVLIDLIAYIIITRYMHKKSRSSMHEIEIDMDMNKIDNELKHLENLLNLIDK